MSFFRARSRVQNRMGKSRHPCEASLRSVALTLLVVAGAAIPAAAAGQDPPRVVTDAAELIPGDTVWSLPKGEYEANAIHRFFMGDGRRNLWSLPFPAVVLDLDKFAGGLIPTGRGGGLQTPSIRFDGNDGMEYAFRSMDKDAARGLAPELRESVAGDIVQDLISQILPHAALVLDPLMDATGILHASPMLARMPADPRLGELEEEFAGALGWIEVRATEREGGGPGFAGSTDLKGSDSFMEALEESPENRAESRAYLKARLFDALVGDWDRHPDQWRWAGFEEGNGVRYEPIPRDRDWALAHMDGLKMWFSRVPWPHRIGFGFDYPSAFRLMWSGRVLDRMLLSELVWEDWEPIVAELQEELTDSVIDDAVARLPPAHHELVGPELERSLKNRRDTLGAFAREFYLLLAGWVEVHATDEQEHALIERLPDNRVRVTVRGRREGEDETSPFFERIFLGEETREVRLFLQGGDDVAEVGEWETGSMLVTIVGGGGDDSLSVSGRGRGARIRFFDDRGDNVFKPGRATSVDESSYEDPHDWQEDTHWAGTRDWGSRTLFLPHLRFEGDGGLLLGASLTRTGYGFRHYPRKDRIRGALAFGSRTERFRAEVDLEFPIHREVAFGHFWASASGAEVHRFYGFGNETDALESREVYRAFSREYELGTGLLLRFSPRLWTEVASTFSHHNPDDNPGTVLATEAPYGFRTFQSLALSGAIRWEGLDNTGWPRKGGSAELQGTIFPALGEVQTAFAKLRGQARTYVTGESLPLEPTLALRAGAEKIWGEFPYHEAAVLGGSSDLLGFPEERFTGDAAVFGNAEVRFEVGTLPAILPGTWGGLALAEAGRVWFEGESSSVWHNSLGTGLWVSIIDTFTLTVSVARSDEGTRFLYGGGGFHF